MLHGAEFLDQRDHVPTFCVEAVHPRPPGLVRSFGFGSHGGITFAVEQLEPHFGTTDDAFEEAQFG